MELHIFKLFTFHSQLVTVTWRDLSIHRVMPKQVSVSVGSVSPVSSVMNVPLATTWRSRPVRSATPALVSGLNMLPMSSELHRG